jgi:YbbR domain-containing protein
MTKVKEFFLTAFLKNTGLKVISVIVSIVLWIIVLGSRSVEVVKEIPLVIQTSEDMTVSSDLPDKIQFKLSGPKAFLRTLLDRKEEPITLNLMQNKAGLVNQRFYADQIKLPLGVKVLAVNPSLLSVKLETVRTKEVIPKVQLQNSLPEGYQLVSSEITPKKIKVRGPESRMNDLKEVFFQPITLSELHESVTLPLVFAPSETQLSIVGSQPQITLEIYAIEANYRLRNIEIQVKTTGRYKLDTKTITLYVRKEQNAPSNLC